LREFGSVWFNTGEGRYFNEGEGKRGEVRGDILIKYMFGSKDERGGEGKYFN
jgi:hypothetical protein